MSKYRLDDYLEHMLEAANDACSFIEQVSEKAFLENKLIQNAVLMSIIVIGESATKIMKDYKEFVAIHPEIAWHKISGMRNRLAHEYFDVDYDTIWLSTQKYLPQLVMQIEKILDNKNS